MSPGVNVAVRGSPTKERRAGARQRVRKLLERRWAYHLEMDEFPEGFLPVLYEHDFFRELVQVQLESDGVSLPDLDFTPRVHRRPDGEVVDHMLRELGDDPREYVCRDCRAEISRGDVRCRPCKEWRKTGATR